MHQRLATFFVLALLPMAPAAASGGAELTISLGLRSGTPTFTTETSSPLVICITTPCVTAEVLADDDPARLSVILDVPISSRWAIEVLYTEQGGDHEFRSDFPDIVDQGDYDWSTAQAGGLRHWGHGQLRPFGALTLGLTRFESSVSAYDLPLTPNTFPKPVDEEVLSGSLAGGVKVELSDHFDLRLEGRAWWHDLPNRIGGALWQHEASVGLTHRW